MKIFKVIFIFLCGLIVGALAVGIYGRHMLWRIADAKISELSFQSAQLAEWLAEVRLGETTNAIDGMETILSINVGQIAQWTETHPPDNKIRKARSLFLSDVKVYYQNYPVTGDDVETIKSLLATIPGRPANSGSRAGIYRLDDLRLAKMGAGTNSP